MPGRALIAISTRATKEAQLMPLTPMRTSFVMLASCRRRGRATAGSPRARPLREGSLCPRSRSTANLGLVAGLLHRFELDHRRPPVSLWIDFPTHSSLLRAARCLRVRPSRAQPPHRPPQACETDVQRLGPCGPDRCPATSARRTPTCCRPRTAGSAGASPVDKQTVYSVFSFAFRISRQGHPLSIVSKVVGNGAPRPSAEVDPASTARSWR